VCVNHHADRTLPTSARGRVLCSAAVTESSASTRMPIRSGDGFVRYTPHLRLRHSCQSGNEDCSAVPPPMLRCLRCPRASSSVADADPSPVGEYQRHASSAPEQKAPAAPPVKQEPAPPPPPPAKPDMAHTHTVPRLHLEALGVARGVLSRISVQQIIEDATQGKPRPVVKLAHNDTIADALALLAEKNILAAPVRAQQKKFHDVLPAQSASHAAHPTDFYVLGHGLPRHHHCER
jgi:hypothetical protein